MKKINFKKDYARLYNPKEKPSIVEVPTFKRIYIKGIGSSKDQSYIKSVDALYMISYYIKTKFVESDLLKYKPFVVAPLEAYWTSTEKESSFEAFINQPKFITEQAFEAAKKYLLEDTSIDNEFIKDAILEEHTEGKSVQALHTGPLEGKESTLKVLDDYIKDNNLEVVPESYHEINLGDLRKLRPENHKVLLRFKIKE